jgi:hypothetical protein
MIAGIEYRLADGLGGTVSGAFPLDELLEELHSRYGDRLVKAVHTQTGAVLLDRSGAERPPSTPETQP